MGWFESGKKFVRWVGFGATILGWVGFQKSDRRPTLGGQLVGSIHGRVGLRWVQQAAVMVGSNHCVLLWQE